MLDLSRGESVPKEIWHGAKSLPDLLLHHHIIDSLPLFSTLARVLALTDAQCEHRDDWKDRWVLILDTHYVREV